MKILLVEDNIAMAESIKRGLQAEGMVVDHAADGLEGSWLALNNPYAVVILDIMLPRKNGYQILRSMRQAEVWTPVLMLTAKDGQYDQADDFDLGADDYLVKPFHFVVLTARLRALARLAAHARPAELTVGPLHLDPASHEVTLNGEPITLTAKEFALLQHFMRHEGEVLSKIDILDDVWGEDFEGNENIVEVYVRKLRQKIDAPHGTEYLTTLRGAGYRLMAR